MFDREEKGPVHELREEEEVFPKVLLRSFQVKAKADLRATNDLYESQQQGAERNARDCFSRERREARLVHRNAENIQGGENANGAKIPKSNKMDTM